MVRLGSSDMFQMVVTRVLNDKSWEEEENKYRDKNTGGNEKGNDNKHRNYNNRNPHVLTRGREFFASAPFLACLVSLNFLSRVPHEERVLLSFNSSNYVTSISPFADSLIRSFSCLSIWDNRHENLSSDFP